MLSVPMVYVLGPLQLCDYARCRPRVREWTPLSATPSKCQSGDAIQPLIERSDRHEDYDSWDRSGKEPATGVWRGRTRQGGAQEATEAQSGTFILREPSAVSDRNGSVRQRASLGAQASEAGTHGEAHGAAVREAVCKNEQERCG